MVIKRVNPFSAAKVGGVFGVLLGLVIGAFISLFMMAIGSATSAMTDESGGALFGALFGIGSIVILPIFYGVVMFIGCLIQAAIYNVVAKWTGGLEIDAA